MGRRSESAPKREVASRSLVSKPWAEMRNQKTKPVALQTSTGVEDSSAVSDAAKKPRKMMPELSDLVILKDIVVVIPQGQRIERVTV